MVETITLKDPMDCHVHFRDGEMLRLVVPFTAYPFSAAVVMPNLEPPITSANQVVNYKQEITDAAKFYDFEPSMTLYFQTNFTRKFLEEVRQHIVSIKFYPKGMTTNSKHGCEPEDPAVEPILGYMEELGIPLCVHGETYGYVLDREKNFLKIYDRWARQFPKLKIIMEHITTRDLVMFLSWYPNVFATITVHHLLITTDDFCGDLLRPHLFCKPLAKRPEDREALRDIAFNHFRGSHEKVMLGTDSAPHTIHKKECDCGCAGVFTSPIALQLLAEEFHKHSDMEHFQRFVSDNAKSIYGLPYVSKTVTLERTPMKIPDRYGNVVPMWAGQEIPWSITKVA